MAAAGGQCAAMQGQLTKAAIQKSLKWSGAEVSGRHRRAPPGIWQRRRGAGRGAGEGEAKQQLKKVHEAVAELVERMLNSKRVQELHRKQSLGKRRLVCRRARDEELTPDAVAEEWAGRQRGVSKPKRGWQLLSWQKRRGADEQTNRSWQLAAGSKARS
ncbi:hypothetical protein IF1G_03613 [Cordyceps javanica]|uniref:Uncharacterized protein n=1 Tax=Cordyceps javanica TaxID=43265 RepID=A0A545V839_9HYPO|nr:hypothetical protein IF1G_03613 [Cordyceps javanica]